MLQRGIMGLYFLQWLVSVSFAAFLVDEGALLGVSSTRDGGTVAWFVV